MADFPSPFNYLHNFGITSAELREVGVENSIHFFLVIFARLFSAFSFLPCDAESCGRFSLLTSQIMPLPNLHPLRAEDVIRSHMMEIEIRQRPIKRVICFLSASPSLPIAGSQKSNMKFQLTLSNEFHLSTPRLENNFRLFICVDVFRLFCISFCRELDRKRENHLHSLQHLNRLRNPLEQLRERLLVVFEGDRLDLAHANGETL